MCTASRSRPDRLPIEAALAQVDPILRRAVQRYSCRRAPADDLWQEARLLFVERYGRWDPARSALTTWAADIARYAALHYLRDVAETIRRPGYIWEAAAGAPLCEVAIEAMDKGFWERREPRHDPTPTTEGDIWVRQMLSLLPERQRRVMQLHLLGWTNAEIGRRLGIQPDSVHAARSHAVIRLRRGLT